jgi:hypothetical protein
VRLMLADVVTGEELRDQLTELMASMRALAGDALVDEAVGGVTAEG